MKPKYRKIGGQVYKFSENKGNVPIFPKKEGKYTFCEIGGS